MPCSRRKQKPAGGASRRYPADTLWELLHWYAAFIQHSTRRNVLADTPFILWTVCLLHRHNEASGTTGSFLWLHGGFIEQRGPLWFILFLNHAESLIAGMDSDYLDKPNNISYFYPKACKLSQQHDIPG